MPKLVRSKWWEVQTILKVLSEDFFLWLSLKGPKRADYDGSDWEDKGGIVLFFTELF